MLEPIVKRIEVPCGPEQAFRVFVQDIDRWWPKDKNSVSAMAGGVARAVRLEPRQGGAVIEHGHDGAEHRWGTVTDYHPYTRFAMDWHINLPPEQASRVEVTFNAVEQGRTEVVLAHSRWEAFGEKAADMRAGYDSGWVGVFEQAYRAACTAPAEVAVGEA